MRTPWTRDQLETLLGHRPPRRADRAARSAREAAGLYRAGWTLREIATWFGCSRSKVSKQLAAQRVTPRRRGQPNGARLSGLAREIAADLAGRFEGEASVPQLIDWLGETRATLTPALEQLRGRDLVREHDGLFSLTPKGHASRRDANDTDAEEGA